MMHLRTTQFVVELSIPHNLKKFLERFQDQITKREKNKNVHPQPQKRRSCQVKMLLIAVTN